MIEIIVFLGTAVAEAGNALRYPSGERHAVIVFLRQEKGIPPDFIAAAESLERMCWSNVSFTHAAPLEVESLNSMHAHAAASYEEAISNGSATLVFSVPVE